ncbi:MAG TPA: patatin-like phospholipase family protein, partial [Holophaga sp.]|nr:patatin-like phospholipase family protein [Holophaga sp.]
MAKKKKLGIALAGGVGYCMTHIGVFQALEAAGIKPDMVAGTSGGALIGALYASGIQLDRIEQIAKTIKWNRLMGAHFLFKGLATSKPIADLVEELLGKGRRFADLGTELLVSTVDLVTERKVIYPDHPAQDIAPAVRASCSLPLVFSPVRDG